MFASAILAIGCTADPQYIESPTVLEANAPGTTVDTATASFDLPLRLEREDELMARSELAAELGIEVPYVRLGDLFISIEWTIKNLEDSEGIAEIGVNGGNEYFYYVPLNFVIDPEEDEEPPSLAGDIPLIIPANGTRSGVFREDALRESALDLELITRAGMNPFAAILEVQEDMREFTADTGAIVPVEAFAGMVRYDVTFTASTHMVMEYLIRVRDDRGILHEELLAAPPEELTVFNPAEFTPPPPVVTP
jgi:hypothetical protein